MRTIRSICSGLVELFTELHGTLAALQDGTRLVVLPPRSPLRGHTDSGTYRSTIFCASTLFAMLPRDRNFGAKSYANLLV
jgi:hypothetical protein